MKFNLSALVSMMAHAGLYGLAAGLVLLAVAVTAIRLYPNLSDVVEAGIESRLSDMLNASVSIESLDISRYQPLSQIVLENVSISDFNAPANIHTLKKARLSIDLAKSLLTGSLKVKALSLEGLDLSVRRDKAGNYHINRMFLLPARQMSQAAKNPYAAAHLNLVGANIRWLDELTDSDYFFKAIDIAIDPVGRGYDIHARGRLPPALGKSLKARLRVRGDISDPANAQIDFYLHTEQFRLAEIARHFVNQGADNITMLLDAELWGQIKNSSLLALRGTVNAEEVADHRRVDRQLCLSDDYIKQLSMQFDWQNSNRNWHFTAGNVRVISARRDWPKTQVALKLHRRARHDKTLFADAGAIHLGAICNTLQTYAVPVMGAVKHLPVKRLQEEHLKHMRLNADIADLSVRADWRENLPPSLQYRLQFDNATLWMAAGKRRLEGVSGYMEGTEAGGKVLLDARQIQIHLPNIYPQLDSRFAVQGEVRWQRRDRFYELHTDYLKIYNQDLDMAARISARLMATNIYIDSQMHVSAAKASGLGRYFPLLQETRATKQWLTEAVKDGDISNAIVLIRGNLRAFPFDRQTGVFATRFDVSNATFAYRPGWPALENIAAVIKINKDRFSAASSQAAMLASRVNKLAIGIDSLLAPVVRLEATVDGPGQDLLRFLGAASLVSENHPVLDQIALSGDSRLQIALRHAVSKKIRQPAEVSGRIHFLGNRLNIKSVGIDLRELGGEIYFDAAGVQGEGLTATLNNRPIALSARALGKGASEFKFDGRFDLGLYLRQRYPHAGPYLAGVTGIEGRLYLPAIFEKNNPDRVKLTLNSRLQGIQTALPAPFDKAATDAWPSVLLFDQNRAMSWQIGDLMTLYFDLNADHAVDLRHVQLGPAGAVEKAGDGLTISGRLENFSPQQWWQVYRRYTHNAAKKIQFIHGPPDIDISIGSLIWPSWPARNLQIKGGLADHQYVLRVHSSLGSGEIKIPQDRNAPVALDMQSLLLAKKLTAPEPLTSRTAASEPPAIDPRQLRPFVFSAQRVGINDLKFKDVRVRARAVKQGLTFEAVELAAQDLKITAAGRWHAGPQHSQTALDIQLDSVDVEDSLRDLGFNSALRSGAASAQINLRWQGAPYQARLDNISGYVGLEMRDGSLIEVEPGAGRLLALLNLGTIIRRLSLDFKDVINKGFAFDTIEGELYLHTGGTLNTDQIKIKSPVAEVTINGLTHLIDQTYDQNITVIPAVASGSLLAAGAIVGGPVGAAAGLLAERVASVVRLNRITKTEYKMTGTWQQPIIKRAGKPPAAAGSVRPPGPP